MSKEAVQFTVKGPIFVQRYPNNPEKQKKTGCSIIDINFQHPCQFGELVFTNYYTAFISIYVKRLSSSNKGRSSSTLSKQSVSKGFPLDKSLTFDGGDGNSKMSHYNVKSTSVHEEEEEWFLQTTETNLKSVGESRKTANANNAALASLSSAVADRPWQCSIYMKCLMTWPHYELGSQDVYSIQATESLVEWREVVLMRIMIHQPSTVWKRFGIEDINIFRNLPKRGCLQLEERSRQKEGWFAVLKNNTKNMLKGQLVEPNLEKAEGTE